MGSQGQRGQLAAAGDREVGVVDVHRPRLSRFTSGPRRAVVAMLSTVRVLSAGILALTLSSCAVDRDPPPIGFSNDSAQPVWVGFNPHAPDGFRVRDTRWKLAAPGEEVVVSDGGECLSFGELVVGNEPQEAMVIDSRPLGPSALEICPGDVWRWSGVGDHE